MKKKPVPASLVSCCVVLAALLLPAASSSQPVVKLEDPAWAKTTSSVVEGPWLGTTSRPIDDPHWVWTSMVWDGPQHNGFGVTIPGWVPGDFWAY
ncbi:MAG: hypothetical protein OEP45_09440, partial [Acidobacteriota bacterium]|nr:hypothetical protein [Acidobacteriota bacterium]